MKNLPHGVDEWSMAARFVVNGIGLGIVHETLLFPVSGSRIEGVVSVEAVVRASEWGLPGA